ncbi:MAG: hypothetical protein IPN29_14425 [Saprospiraceae bacterium]|nr:hypothetical protein [Saprospiraceae bacterium]
MKKHIFLFTLITLLSFISCRQDGVNAPTSEINVGDVTQIDSTKLDSLIYALLKEKKKRKEQKVDASAIPEGNISHPIDITNAQRLTGNFETASGCKPGSDCNSLVKSVYYSFDTLQQLWNRIPADIIGHKKKGFRVYFAKYADSELNPEIAGKNTVIIRATLDSLDIPYPSDNRYHVAFNFGELCPKNCPQILMSRNGRYENKK